MDKLKKVPNIRFEGYDNTWHKDKLSELCDVRDGTHDSPKYLDSGYYFITSKNVKRGYINFDEIKFISKEDYDNINKRSKVDVGDILFGMIGTIGNIAIVRKEPNYAIKNVALIKDIKKLYNYFNYYFLQSPNIENQLDSGLDGGTQKFVSLKSIRGLDVIFPKYKEQTQIGNFFKTLDEKLGLEKEKHEKLVHFKKAMLEDMFPKEGEKMPKIRFEGFDGEWDYLKLSDLGEVSSSGVDKKFYPNEKTVHLLNYMDVYNKKQPSKDNIYEFMRTSANERKLISKSVIKGDVFFTPTSETSDDIGHSMAIYNTIDDLVYSYHLLRFRPFDNVLDVSFSNYFANINPVRKQLITNCQGAQRMTLKLEEFEKLMVSLPSIEEQSQIGNFFKNLDEKIELSEQKIVKIENFKKAMLDKMFV